jgi:hypothetical protein
MPFGGVGGLPVEGFNGVSVVGDEPSRGFRNIALGPYLLPCAVLVADCWGR